MPCSWRTGRCLHYEEIRIPSPYLPATCNCRMGISSDVRHLIAFYIDGTEYAVLTWCSDIEGEEQMAHLVTVVGASGNVGKVLAERLLQRGVRVRAVTRSAERVALLAEEGAEICSGDLHEIDFTAEAFRGADASFAMLPTHVDAPDFCADLQKSAAAIVEALRIARVRRVVILSAAGAHLPSGTGPIAGLHAFEQMLLALPQLAVVALRPSYFMENLLAAIPIIKQAGFFGAVVRADLVHPMIAARDIAAVAAGYLSEPAFSGYTVRELLGPREYTHREAAGILGAAIGRPDLPYVEFSYVDFHKGLLDAAFSQSAADTYLEMFTAFNEGRIQPEISRNRHSTTPTTLDQFAHEIFAPAFAAS
jgi:uncharacterized protein YbjT (DUF2867 family)